MRSFTYTHKGWFGLCPVYLANLGSDAPDIDERHWLLTPWMTFNGWLLNALIFVKSVLDPDYEPAFPILVTGELAEPVTMTYPDLD